MLNYNGGVKNRRKRALARLEKQKSNLLAGIKREKDTIVGLKKKIPANHMESVGIKDQLKAAEYHITHSEGRLPRIESEIATLKTRI